MLLGVHTEAIHGDELPILNHADLERRVFSELIEKLIALIPVRGERNEPADVLGTIKLLAELRGWTEEKAQQQVWQSYRILFKA